MNYLRRYGGPLTILLFLQACVPEGPVHGRDIPGPNPGPQDQASYCNSLFGTTALLPANVRTKPSTALEWKIPGRKTRGNSSGSGRRILDRSFYNNHSVEKDPEFIDYVYAITAAESNFDPTLISDKEAYGLMQLTSGGMIDGAAYCRIPILRDLRKLLDPVTNIKYSTCYLKFLREQTDRWVPALVLYNGGYRALALYEQGKRVANETAQYVLQVERTVHICRTGGIQE